MRKQLLIVAVALAVPGLGGLSPARAQGGQTSGPAVGGNVTPSTVAQKLFERRSGFVPDKSAPAFDASAMAAGTPGVEGKPGAQSGGAPQRRGATPEAVY